MGIFDSISGAFGQIGGALETVTNFADSLGGALNAVQSLGGGNAAPLYLPAPQPPIFSPPITSSPPPQGALPTSFVPVSEEVGPQEVGMLDQYGGPIAAAVVAGVLVYLITK